MSFDFSTLVMDRSQADLDALRALLATPLADWTAEQLEEFAQAKSKGAYNYTDLNRVTACMGYLNEVLTGLGYVTGYAPVVVDPQAQDPYLWTEDDVPTQSQMEQYLANVFALRDVLPLGPVVFAPPDTMVGLRRQDANSIEALLDQINDTLVAMQSVFLRSAMVWAVSAAPEFRFVT